MRNVVIKAQPLPHEIAQVSQTAGQVSSRARGRGQRVLRTCGFLAASEHTRRNTGAKSGAPSLARRASVRNVMIKATPRFGQMPFPNFADGPRT